MSLYRAFISYRHSSESRVIAQNIESSLKQYSKPVFKFPIKIFRDESELKLGEDLDKSIKRALKNSEFLILLANKESAESPWVQDELMYWHEELKRTDNFIVVYVDDDLVYESDTKTIDWDKTNALPSALKPFISSIPLYVDLKWVKAANDLNLSNIRFKDAINAISARLNGKTPYEMNGAEILTTRRNRKIRNVGILTISCLFLIAVFLGIYSNNQRKIADDRANTAESRSLSMQSKLMLDKQFDLSLLLAAQAYKIQSTSEATSAIIEALNYNPYLDFYLYSEGEPPVEALFDPFDDSILVTHGNTIELSFWNLISREKEFELHLNDRISSIQFNTSGTLIAAGHSNGKVSIVNNRIATRTYETISTSNESWISSIVFMSDSIFVFSSSEGIYAHNLSNDSTSLISDADEAKSNFLLYNTEEKVLISKGSTSLTFWDLSSLRGEVIAQIADNESPYSFAFNSDQSLMAVGSHFGLISIWDYQARRKVGQFKIDGRVLAVQFCKNRLYASGVDEQIHFWDFNTSPIEHNVLPKANNGTVDDIKFSSKGGRMISLSRDGKIAVSDIQTKSKLIRNMVILEMYDFPKIDFHSEKGIALLGNSGALFIYRVNKSKYIHQNQGPFKLSTSPLETISFSKDGNSFISTHANKKLYIWDIKGTDVLVRDSIQTNHVINKVIGLDFGDFLLSDLSGGIIRFDPIEMTGKKIFQLDVSNVNRTSPVIGVFDFHQEKELLAIATNDYQVIVGFDNHFDTLDFNANIQFLKFDKSAERLLLADGNQIKSWDIVAKQFEETFLIGNLYPITHFDVSDDGKYLSAVDNDNSLTLWDLSEKKQLGSSISGVFSDPIYCAFFNKNSNILSIDSRYITHEIDSFPFRLGQRYVDVYEFDINPSSLLFKIQDMANREIGDKLAN